MLYTFLIFILYISNALFGPSSAPLDATDADAAQRSSTFLILLFTFDCLSLAHRRQRFLCFLFEAARAKRSSPTKRSATVQLIPKKLYKKHENIKNNKQHIKSKKNTTKNMKNI